MEMLFAIDLGVLFFLTVQKLGVIKLIPWQIKTPNTTLAEFANTVDPDEMAHNWPFHLDLQCLPSSV